MCPGRGAATADGAPCGDDESVEIDADGEHVAAGGQAAQQ
jgi:hypothetical protein